MNTSKLIILLTFIFIGCNESNKQLPVLSVVINEDGKKEEYHVEFGDFKNQDGEDLTPNQYQNKITTVNFFFTSCPSICPPMRTIQIDLANHFKNESQFTQLSFSIDPEKDTTTILKAYAKNTGIQKEHWQFFNGSENDLKKLAQQLKTTYQPTEDGLDIYHSSYLALLDKKQQIRGFYNILKPVDAALLKEDINVLLKED